MTVWQQGTPAPMRHSADLSSSCKGYSRTSKTFGQTRCWCPLKGCTVSKGQAIQTPLDGPQQAPQCRNLAQIGILCWEAMVCVAGPKGRLTLGQRLGRKPADRRQEHHQTRCGQQSAALTLADQREQQQEGGMVWMALVQGSGFMILVCANADAGPHKP